jgi:hypothetical protein
MAKFIFKKRISRRSRKETNLVNKTGVIRKPMYSSVFQNDNDGSFFELDDVQIMRHKRNKTICMFFETYSNKEKYQLFEFGLPYLVSENMSVIIRKLKRKCNSINNKVLGYLWVYDVGEENFGEHYHLLIATMKINDNKYPNALKLNFKGSKIHGDFVRTDEAFKNYLIGKCLYDRGYRKRLYGKSINFKTIRTNINESKDYLKTI